jgi:hypothetical protein
MTQFTLKSFSVFPKRFKKDNSPKCPLKYLKDCKNIYTECDLCELVQGKPTNFKK